MARRVLITRATRGLGLGMARHFADRGYALALEGRRRRAKTHVDEKLKDL